MQRWYFLHNLNLSSASFYSFCKSKSKLILCKYDKYVIIDNKLRKSRIWHDITCLIRIICIFPNFFLVFCAKALNNYIWFHIDGTIIPFRYSVRYIFRSLYIFTIYPPFVIQDVFAQIYSHEMDAESIIMRDRKQIIHLLNDLLLISSFLWMPSPKSVISSSKFSHGHQCLVVLDSTSFHTIQLPNFHTQRHKLFQLL